MLPPQPGGANDFATCVAISICHAERTPRGVKRAEEESTGPRTCQLDARASRRAPVLPVVTMPTQGVLPKQLVGTFSEAHMRYHSLWRPCHVHPTRQEADQVQTHHGRRGRSSAPRVRIRQHLRLRSVSAARRFPQRYSRKIIWPDFPGIRIAASRRSLTFWPERSSTATAWAITAPSPPATFSG